MESQLNTCDVNPHHRVIDNSPLPFYNQTTKDIMQAIAPTHKVETDPSQFQQLAEFMEANKKDTDQVGKTAIRVQLPPSVMEKVSAKTGFNHRAAKATQKKAKKQYQVDECWSDVTSLRSSCADLLRTSMALLPLLKERPLMGLVDDLKLLQRNVAAITRDTGSLSQELQAIGIAVDRTRKTCTNVPMAMAGAQSAFQHYINFMERFDSSLLPIVTHTSEQLQNALNRYKEVSPVRAHELETELSKTLEYISYVVRDSTGAQQKAA